MARRTQKPRYDPMPLIHDHFDGSAHCQECGGSCKLTGADLALTNLIRAMFEANAYHGQAWSYMAQLVMVDLGVNIELFKMRARETNKRVTP